MMCYKDITFCTNHATCKHGSECDHALTEKVKQDAKRWWGGEGAPIAFSSDKFDCWEEKGER